MNKPVLTFENIGKRYDLRLLYKNVSFNLYSGQTALITGKNGSGKSTLLKMIAELTKPSQGKILCTAEKGEIGYLGHHTFIYPHLSACENLRFWAKAFQKNISEQEIAAVLKKVFLEKFSHDRAGIFSRGMAQRLNIARIILQAPQLLLLDEPDTGLDKESRELFYSVIKDFQEQKACILWVSHNPQIDSAYATHVLHIEKQQIILTELCQAPKISQSLEQSPEQHGENA